ncbi:Dyp-type peroxidase [Flavobacterium hibernum]|uniref:Peroxidase n=1 Tax=Flavobacterium hibernum TaxID=37752 RepID=A0A0D0EX91_9FLAO|nr:Dyp-type peroxidase [Flavobacterium hibernum]KIO51801.1 peroxidase [Flavobacterium hibernum]OXA91840.1 peroxidase [Flavobacterium hibernum]STO19031.1 Probable deferrochelatase/peroxidase YfeX [Flavobacterium hibernum]
MNKSQSVTDYPNNNTIFMVWNFKDQTDIKPAFEKICSLVNNLNKSFTIRIPDGRSSCVMGIGHDAWIKLQLPTPLPKELVNFESINGGKHSAKATSGDLHFHLRGLNMAICFDMATAISNVLQPVAECLDEIHGFRYWDGRSIIGFVDGTENPIGEERKFFAVVGDEDSTYKGGSYLFVQKYFHNMKNWESLSTEDQEKVIGRYKMNDIEMDDNVKPNNSHSALTSITDENGNDLKIVRDNMPFGNPSKGEVGTYFIAYASTFSTTKKMLENMFIGNPPGNYDRILDFSTAQTGALFFVPTLEVLDEYSSETNA